MNRLSLSKNKSIVISLGSELSKAKREHYEYCHECGLDEWDYQKEMSAIPEHCADSFRTGALWLLQKAEEWCKNSDAIEAHPEDLLDYLKQLCEGQNRKPGTGE